MVHYDKLPIKSPEPTQLEISSDSDDETPILGSPDFPTEQAAGGISTTQTYPKQEAVQRRRPPVPFKFATRNIKKNRSDVILELPDGRFWSAECKIRNLDDKGLPKSAGLYSGWSAFAMENNLEVGDVCIFELVTTTEKISFRVFIERLADDAYHQLYSSGS
ncbi:B3 DNA binding domain containing protein [Trema orientale]|uniref:B3 DNA binding domain containing protein n=1 Tax=Trema orientale TaxID=63057 RepID=A0A2P5E4H0_TREOI|nr:B3 DNA binding domain containing protein [Trema orientale]